MASGPTWNPRRGTWYVQFWQRGKWHRKSVTKPPMNWKPGMILPEPKKIPPEAIAWRTHYDRIEKEAREREKAGAPANLKTFLDENVARYDMEATRESVQITTTQFLAWCADRHVETIDQVIPELCDQWINDPEYKWTIGTAKRKRAHMSRPWRRLKKLKGTPNPWEGIELHRPRGKEEKGSWTKEEFSLLLPACEPWLQDVLILGVNSGLRINALIKLEWRDWLKPKPTDVHLGYIQVRKELDKIHRGYKVPVSRELHDKLLAPKTGEKNGRVLLDRDGEPIANRHRTYGAIKAACKKAGLAPPGSPNHYMRRTFGRWAHFGDLTGTPVPLYIVSRWLGHTNTRTTLAYLDIKEEDDSRFMVPGEEA